MKKNKKMLTLLSITAIASLISMALSTAASAKTTAIDINGTDGKVYEYDYSTLKTSAIACILNGANDPGAKLYNDFMTRNKTISAFYDDVKKSYIDANVVKQAAVNAAISGNPSSFVLDTFTSSTSTPVITLTPSKITADNNGNIVVGNQSATLAVDLTTLALNTTSVPYTTIATFKLNVSDPQDYTVTVKGNATQFNSSTGVFGTAVNGTLSISDFSQSDFIITSKSASSTTTSAILSNITLNRLYCSNNPNAALTAGDTIDSFYIDYTATDSNGNAINNYNAIKDGLMTDAAGEVTGLISSNPNDVTVSLVQDPNNSSNALIQVIPTANSKNIVIDEPIVISVFTSNGKSANINLTLKKAVTLDNLTLSVPSTTVYAGENNVNIPFTAVDQNGNVLTKYSDINGEVSVCSTFPTDALQLVENSDGTASLQLNVPSNAVQAPHTSQSYTIQAVALSSGKYSHINIEVMKK